MAYRLPAKIVPMECLIIDFYQVDVHESFYKELKQYPRHEERTGKTP
jgi:hypothetical protein